LIQQFGEVRGNAVQSSTGRLTISKEKLRHVDQKENPHDTEEETPTMIINWLRQQQLEVNVAQSVLVQRLRDFGIPVGLPPGSRQLQEMDEADDIAKRVTVSTRSNPIECRVTLGRTQVGRKCVSPCQCIGSQKWVQFSVLNKLRRKDPQAWITCPTCRTAYRFDLLYSNADVKTSILSAVLDNLTVLRSAMALLLLSAVIWSHFLALIMRFLVSRSLWQKFPQWSKITRLPLAMKIWLGKLAFTFLWDRYIQFEKATIVDALANIETEWLEESLPCSTENGGVDDRVGDEGSEDSGEEEAQ
jgi:hypothetical protein